MKDYNIQRDWKDIDKLYCCNYCNHAYITAKSVKRHLKKNHLIQ